MKFKDKIYFLLSYTNEQDLKAKYPHFNTIICMNVFGIILYFLIPSFLAKAIFTLLLIMANVYFKETRGIMITMAPITICKFFFIYT